MQILVVSGYAPNKNSSANLSHNAFVEGLIKQGYKVDILCHSFDVSDDISIPNFDKVYTYNGLSLYEKLAQKNNRSGEKETSNESKDLSVGKSIGFKSKCINTVKTMFWAMYGVYNTTVVWYYRAKKFKTNTKYECIISMGYPPVSHRLTDCLLKHKHVFAKKWIQLWEDPWYYSLELRGENSKVKKAEYKLLDSAQEVVYVSPITLQNQQRIFDRDKDKMRWCPLAAYYNAEKNDYSGYKENQYGYFGDYLPYIRNLEPFYNVAVNKSLNVDICGTPSDLFPSKNNVKIYPRLPLGELKEHEDKANIVVCLFNLGGGQIPGKIYQLAATNKTILAILDGPDDEQKIIRDYFEKFNRFVFCQNNEQSISEAIEKIENNDLGSISNAPIDDFSVEKVAKMLLGD